MKLKTVVLLVGLSGCSLLETQPGVERAMELIDEMESAGVINDVQADAYRSKVGNLAITLDELNEVKERFEQRRDRGGG